MAPARRTFPGQFREMELLMMQVEDHPIDRIPRYREEVSIGRSLVRHLLRERQVMSAPVDKELKEPGWAEASMYSETRQYRLKAGNIPAGKKTPSVTVSKMAAAQSIENRSEDAVAISIVQGILRLIRDGYGAFEIREVFPILTVEQIAGVFDFNRMYPDHANMILTTKEL